MVSPQNISFTIEVYNNIPIRVNKIDDMRLKMGKVHSHKFSDQLFSDADEKDAIFYKLFLNESDELPLWVSFDPVERTAYFDTTNKTIDGKTFQFNLRGADNFTASTKIPFKVTLWSSVPVLKK